VNFYLHVIANILSAYSVNSVIILAAPDLFSRQIFILCPCEKNFEGLRVRA
jgi:hypothetical protein